MTTRACRLPEPELRERAREIRESFVPGILEVEEREDGFVYWFARSDEWFARVTDFARFESRCCDFLDFEIGLAAAGERISLRISGPVDAKPFLIAAGYGRAPAADEDS